jgi:hypothetical protein
MSGCPALGSAIPPDRDDFAVAWPFEMQKAEMGLPFPPSFWNCDLFMTEGGRYVESNDVCIQTEKDSALYGSRSTVFKASSAGFRNRAADPRSFAVIA